MAVIWPFPTLEKLGDDMRHKISRMQRECNAYAKGHFGPNHGERIRERWHDDNTEFMPERNPDYTKNMHHTSK